MKATEGQYEYIESILNDADIFNRRPLDFDKENDWGYETRDDAIYIDGDITFDMMAQIVDYLRGEKR